MRKSVDPSLMIFNYNSMSSSCNATHTDYIFTKIEALVNSIMVSRGLSLVQWNGGERIRRVLRGDAQGSRRLLCSSCPACPSLSYFCASRCPNCRRREEEETDCLPIQSNSFFILEGYAESVRSNMKHQCEELVKSLSDTDDGGLSSSCMATSSLITCDVHFELASLAELRRITEAPSAAPSTTPTTAPSLAPV
jgi:hypothetical protein